MEDKLLPERELWDKYLRLTRELLKSINAKKIDLFLEQVDQKYTMLDQLKALPEEGFRQTEEYQAIKDELKALEMQIIYKAKAWLNKSRRQNMNVRSYDLIGVNPLGHKINKSF